MQKTGFISVFHTFMKCVGRCAKLPQSCITLQPFRLQLARLLCHGILQARILQWVAMPSSRGSSGPRGQTHVSCGPYIAGRFFTTAPLRKSVLWSKLLQSFPWLSLLYPQHYVLYFSAFLSPPSSETLFGF